MPRGSLSASTARGAHTGVALMQREFTRFRMPDRVNLVRRRLAQFGALSASLPLAVRTHAAFQAVPSGHRAALSELGYHQVRLSSGPLQRQATGNHSLLMNLDEDALLRPFRLRAGLPAPGYDLGGWYDSEGFAPGATFGQWLSALCRYHAISGDAATRAKTQRLVAAYAASIDQKGRFYRHNRFPAYTYDKLVGGLVDALRHTHDSAALAALLRTTRAARPYLPPHAVPHNEAAKEGEDFSTHAWDESYTLPENQFLAWRETGYAQYFASGRRFLYDEFFAPLAAGQNVLPGKHAYSHVNSLSSAAQAYLSTGEPMYLRAAQQGFAMIDAQSYATGGWGPDEHFIEPGSGALGASLEDQIRSFETPCGAYAHFKLTRYLLRITRDSRYGDSMERVLYNTILGALPIQPDGHAFYHSDYTRRAQKCFNENLWPCCSGTLPMIAADYAISTCFQGGDGLYVNLYAPAQVSWLQGGSRCGLSIRTEYPFAGNIELRVSVPNPQTFAVYLRIPAWAAGAAVRVNGKSTPSFPEPATFAAIHREWRDGDRIELELPLPLRLQSVDDQHTNTVALLVGPLALMRLVNEASGDPPPLTRDTLLAARRIDAVGHEWQVELPDQTVRLRPFVDIGRERYSLYQDTCETRAVGSAA